MGLFGNLLEKKNCGVCGNELGLLGKRKLEDGYLCKECASKLSPFFSERRSSTLDQIREQLAYREENKKAVEAFNPTKTVGEATRVIFDEDARKFIVTSQKNWRDANPDVMTYAQATGCEVETKEQRQELFWKDDEGNRRSYDPPRYDVDYQVWVTIHINSPWFEQIRFMTNDHTIEERFSVEFQEAERRAAEIKSELASMRQSVRDEASAAAAPKAARTCPFCGATTTPDESGRCEYCGGAMGM
ncbi:hypothetical protein JI75_04720 [Berryella intestinalis]|uniref:DUF4428 domain-containing protein n=1 Tax=Berryella intestinalis TaxID=1531429 RepID=A0A0A8B3Y5_9ACTN|nr:DUF4428 domain-containing protein [Berryella intestinalis]AJC12075.1 hypothetical protein JI75_04720 [Berryella intestinalis]